MKTVFILIIYPFRKYLFWTSNLMFAVINLRPQSSVTHDSNKQTNNFRRCNNPAFSRWIIRAKYHQMLRQCQSLTTHFPLFNPRNTAPWQQGPGRGTAPSADGVLWRPTTVRGGRGGSASSCCHDVDRAAGLQSGDSCALLHSTTCLPEHRDTEGGAHVHGHTGVNAELIMTHRQTQVKKYTNPGRRNYTNKSWDWKTQLSIMHNWHWHWHCGFQSRGSGSL